MKTTEIFNKPVSQNVAQPSPKTEIPKKKDGKLSFVILSTFGELLDMAVWLKDVEGHEVLLQILDSDYKRIGDGMVDKIEYWYDQLGKEKIWVIDGCENADLQDWLRNMGEYVVGSNVEMARLEDDRQAGQDWFKKAGFAQPFSKNFTDIDECIAFVKKNNKTKWILKQNGSAPKMLNHKGKFDDGIDMIFHLEEMKKGWNEQEFGKFDCDLMEIADGTEIAASAFFNGTDFLRNEDGKVVGFLNFEEKKETDGNRGETTGETGTTFVGVDEDNEIFADILLRTEIIDKLQETDFRGVFDINGCITKDGFVAFEATSRFGIPATSYEFLSGLKSNTGELLAAMAMGLEETIDLHMGVGMVVVICAKPYPIEAHLSDEHTSLGEKLWIMQKGEPVKEFTKDQKYRIHLENFEKTPEGDYKVATKGGYLLTVTGRGKTVEKTREDLLEFVEENIYIAGMKWRTDIGKRIDDFDYGKY